MNRTFPILGTTVAELVGYSEQMTRCISDLTKANPAHLQVVGPRFSGKTTFIHALKKHPAIKAKYNCVIYWDLGHNTPQSNDDFIAQFSNHLSEALKQIHSECSQYFREAGNDYDAVKEAIEVMSDENIVILMLWDGMGKPLASGNLSRNLWDQLRELAMCPGLRLLTASRKPLQELLRNEESQTSDFWNIFEQVPVKLECIPESDINRICSDSGITLGDGALKELFNWTGFNPPLLFEVMNYVIDSGDLDLTNKKVNNAAESSREWLAAILDKLWADISTEAQEVFHDLIESQELDESKVSNKSRLELTKIGLLSRSGNKFKPGCRLIHEISKQQRQDKGALDRVFSDEHDFDENIAKVLLLRLKQIPNKHPKIYSAIERSILDVPDDLESCLSNIRQVTNKFFDLIWDIEFKGRKFPDGLLNIWDRDGTKLNDYFRTGLVPKEPSKELNVLQILVGSKPGVKSHASYVNKQTYHYMNTLYSYGNFGQHFECEEVLIGSAVTAVVAAMELLKHLTNFSLSA